jgi:hypothetical protein
MCAMPSTIGQDLSDRNNCHYYFAVCESCLLISTISESSDDWDIAYCPRCLEKEKLYLIPLSPDGIYIHSHLNSMGIHSTIKRQITAIANQLGDRTRTLRHWYILLFLFCSVLTCYFLPIFHRHVLV